MDVAQWWSPRLWIWLLRVQVPSSTLTTGNRGAPLADSSGKGEGWAPVAQLDRVPDFESVGRRFESCRAYLLGPLAQLVEQQTLNLRVEGSIPSRLRGNGGIDRFFGSWLSSARVVKLADTPDLGSGALWRKGSSPFSRNGMALYAALRI